MKIKTDEWIWFNDSNKWMSQIEQKPLNYYTDMYEAGQTKQRLVIGREVKNIDADYCTVLLNSQSVFNRRTDNLTFWSTLIGNSSMKWADRINILEDWVYLISAQVMFTPRAWNRRSIYIKLNWWSDIMQSNVANNSNMSVTASTNLTIKLIKWNYLTVSCYQDSWASINTSWNSITPYNSFLQVTKL